jgi:hypothetical protein
MNLAYQKNNEPKNLQRIAKHISYPQSPRMSLLGMECHPRTSLGGQNLLPIDIPNAICQENSMIC